jgi:hypothetical protein
LTLPPSLLLSPPLPSLPPPPPIGRRIQTTQLGRGVNIRWHHFHSQ